jgi:4-amino-4-deoxy-L-arabinose transferase-like glycosyltransferase
MLLDGVVAVVLVSIGRLLGSEREGIVAGVLWLLFPPAIAVSTWITAETCFTAALLASIYFLFVSTREKSLVYPVVAGSLLGVATLLRATTILLPLFLVPIWLRRDVENKYKKGACFTISAMLIILSWTVRNEVVLQDRIPVAVSFGAGVLQGSAESSLTIDGKRQAYPEMVRLAALDGIVKPDTEKESAIDHYLLRVGIHNYQLAAKENPFSVVLFFVHKTVRLWYGTETGGLKQQLFLAFCSIVIVPLGVWQIFRWRVTHNAIATIIILTLLYFILLHLAVVPQYRYVHPIYPLLILAAWTRVAQLRASA